MDNAIFENINLPRYLPIWFHYDTSSNGILPIPPHWHSQIELLYVTHGQTQIQINNTEVIAKRGDFIAIPPHAIHSCISVDGQSKYHTLTINEDYCRYMGFDTKKNVFEVPINDDKINSIMEDIIYAYYSDDKYTNAKLTHNIMQLLMHLFDNHARESTEAHQRKNVEIIIKAFAYIDKNFNTSLTIGEIANHVGMSVSHFGHIFKETTKMSPLKYINFTRIRKASVLLTQGKYSISQISDMCGFSDTSYFTKTFKKYTNSLPSQKKSLCWETQ